MIMGCPYLLTRFSKWSLVASYLWSFFDTAMTWKQISVRKKPKNNGKWNPNNACLTGTKRREKDTLIHKHTYDVRLEIQSWSFLWPEKWDWSTILDHRTNLHRDPLWNVLKYNLLSFNIICNPALFIHAAFQISTSRESRKNHYTLPSQPSDKKYQIATIFRKRKALLMEKKTMSILWVILDHFKKKGK